MATTKLEGNLVNLSGNNVNVGDLAPVVKIVSCDLNDMEIGGEQGEAQVIVVVPSIDTSVCATEVRTFNEKAASINHASITVVSMDLPFAMRKFCTAENVGNLKVGSDFRNKDFANAYGVLIADGPYAGVTCRAVFVIDANGRVTYKEICPEITSEPDYDAVLAAIKDATSTSCCGSCQ